MAIENLPPTALARALVKAIEAARSVPRRGENKHHHYRYATAEDVFTEARAALAGQGLALLPHTARLVPVSPEIPQLVLLRGWTLVHVSGEERELEGAPWPVVPGLGRPLDKALAAADTASLRWLLRDLLLLPTVEASEDMDRDAEEPARPAIARAEVAEAPRVSATTAEGPVASPPGNGGALLRPDGMLEFPGARDAVAGIAAKQALLDWALGSGLERVAIADVVTRFGAGTPQATIGTLRSVADALAVRLAASGR